MAGCRIALLFALMLLAVGVRSAAAEVKAYRLLANQFVTQMSRVGPCHGFDSILNFGAVFNLQSMFAFGQGQFVVRKDGTAWIPGTTDLSFPGFHTFRAALSANGVISGEVVQTLGASVFHYRWTLDLNSGAYHREVDDQSASCPVDVSEDGVASILLLECPDASSPTGWFLLVGSCPAITTVPLVRYNNSDPAVLDHFYTTSFSEIGCGQGGWFYEGSIGLLLQSQSPGTTALYRFWSASLGDHFYTTNPSDADPSYVAEGVTGYIFTSQESGTVPLFRWWSPGARDHLYTTDPNELSSGTSGYQFEGVTGWVYPARSEDQFNCPAIADLITSAVSGPPPEIQPGDTFSLDVTVHNIGTGQAGGSQSRYFLSADGAARSYEIGSLSVPALAPGTNSRGVALVAIPNNVADGTYLVLACANDSGAVQEATRDNNCRSSSSSTNVGPLRMLTDVLQGAVYLQSYGPISLRATGGSPPYSWTVSALSLPAGLAIGDTGQGAAISGVVTEDAEDATNFNHRDRRFDFNLTLADATGRTVIKAFTIDLTCGDGRDALIEEYRSTGVLDSGETIVPWGTDFVPRCKDATQTASSANFTFAELNTPSPSRTPDHGWALIRRPLVAAVSPVGPQLGLDAWVLQFGASRVINSGFRAPIQNMLAGGAIASRHMFGDAVDLRNESHPSGDRKSCNPRYPEKAVEPFTACLIEYNRMVKAAWLAGASYVEPPELPCKYNCTHADWRRYPAPFAK